MKQRSTTLQKLKHDEWGRNEVYFAEFGSALGGGGRCMFATLDPAIFYVVSSLGNDIDWKKFPDPSKKYPYEDRDGSNHDLTPVFIVRQKTADGREVFGSVQKMAVANTWYVGNGIAVAARKQFAEATGRDVVKVSGKGAKLQGRVGPRNR
jgi:hypothetical protein